MLLTRLRVEIEGCINTLQNPRFEVPTTTRLDEPLLALKQPSDFCYGFKELSKVFGFDDHLLEILHQAQDLPSILNTTSPAEVDELTTNVQWSLLLLQSKTHEDPESNYI